MGGPSSNHWCLSKKMLGHRHAQREDNMKTQGGQSSANQGERLPENKNKNETLPTP